MSIGRYKTAEIILLTIIISISMPTLDEANIVNDDETKAEPPNERLQPFTSDFTDLSEIKFEIKRDHPDIAFVYPSFTAAAYSGFYTAYRMYNSYGSYGLPKLNAASYFIKSASNIWSTGSPAGLIQGLKNNGYPSEKIHYISDVDVHNGNLFDSDGLPKYSTLLFVHNEYVTQEEYMNMVRFIKSGGNVIILNGNAFFGEVEYNSSTGMVHQVSGHAWDFDGQNGTSSLNYHRFYESGISDEHNKMFGSRYCTFNKGPIYRADLNIGGDNPHPVAKALKNIGYTSVGVNLKSHEENCVITPNYQEIADWKTSFTEPNRGVKIYEFFPYGAMGGSLIHLGLYSTDFIGNRPKMIKLVETSIYHQGGMVDQDWIRYPMDGAVLRENIMLDYRTFGTAKVFINNTYYTNLRRGSSLNFLGDGVYNLTLEFSNSNSRSVMFTIDTTPPSVVYGYNTSLPSPFNTFPQNMSFYDDNGIETATFMKYGDIRQVLGSRTWEYDGSNKSRFLNFDNIGSQDIALKVYVRDKAGNVFSDLLLYDNDTSQLNIKALPPIYQRIDDDTLAIFAPNNPGYPTYLQVTRDLGTNWENYPMQYYDDDLLVTYYNRSETDFIYRIALTRNNVTDYFPSPRSYNWDLALPYVASHNLQPIMNGDEQLEFSLNQINNANLNYTIGILGIDDPVQYSFNTTSVMVNYTLPNLSGGRYQLLINFDRYGLNSSYSIPFYVGTNNSTSLTTSNIEIVYPGDGTFTDLIFTPDPLTEWIEWWSSVGLVSTFGSDGFNGILLKSLKETTFEFKEYDIFGNHINTVEIKLIKEPDFPTVTGDLDVELTIGDSKTLSWYVFGASGTYILYRNSSSILSGSWDSGDVVEYILNNASLGIWEYSLHLQNTAGSTIFTTNVLVVEQQYTETTSLTNTTSFISSQTSSQTSTTTVAPLYQTPSTTDEGVINPILPVIIMVLLAVNNKRKKR